MILTGDTENCEKCFPFLVGWEVVMERLKYGRRWQQRGDYNGDGISHVLNLK